MKYCSTQRPVAPGTFPKPDDNKVTLAKQELMVQLRHGHTLNDHLAFGPGQNCEIFKADKFYHGDEVIYVPDVSLNQIPLDRPITDLEELDEVLSNCYTGQDFIDECHGDVEKAKRLFCYCGILITYHKFFFCIYDIFFLNNIFF